MAISSRKVSLNIFGLKGITLLVNLLILSVSAKYFGLSIDRDIWIISTAFLVNLNNAFFNPISDVFRIKYIQIKEEESLHSALTKTGSLLIFYLILIIFLIISFSFFGNYVLHKLFIIDGLMLQKYYEFIKILLYSIFFTQFTSIGIGILNAHNIFYISEITAFFTSISNLIIIYFVTPYVGIGSLYIGQYFNLSILLFAVFYFLKKNKLLPIINLKSLRIKDAKIFILFGLPFYFPYIVGQINSLVEKVLSNRMGAGVISMIDYAQKFTSLFQVVFTSIILTSIIPQLTKNFSRKELKLYYDSFFNYLKFVILILSFFVPLLYVTSYEINYIFFRKGEVTIYDIEGITYLTKLYSITFMFICLYVYISPVMISQMKNRLQAVLGIITQLMIIGFNFLFYMIFKQSVFAISLGIFHFIVVLVMLHFLIIENKKQVYIYIVKSIIIILFLVFIGEIISCFLMIKNIYLSLIIKGGLMLIIILLLSFLLEAGLFSYFKQILNKWKLKI
jgi:peptidoglycan biosynthesis protein MviN/MurJ (putative lipid II flippase)